ncbi:MAG: ribosome-associated translation inhibitor RaiA [Rhodospirillaceae bacterium]|nr:ribosome-associated translation inhibitor RaiA [Rhodospirillaceae bacterium]
MQLTVRGKQLDVGGALRTHIAQTLDGLIGKYFGNPIEATVVLSREAHLYRAQISVHVGRGILVQGEAAADEPYPAFDAAAERIAKRLRRYKRRLRDHHRSAPEVEPARQYVLAPAGEDFTEPVDGVPAEPIVIAEMEAEIPTLSVSEAVMRLDLSEAAAIMFRNRAHGGLNMIYRRGDGNVGWVDPHGNSSH